MLLCQGNRIQQGSVPKFGKRQGARGGNPPKFAQVPKIWDAPIQQLFIDNASALCNNTNVQGSSLTLTSKFAILI